jgi:hypothetical protein
MEYEGDTIPVYIVRMKAAVAAGAVAMQSRSDG